MYSSRYILGEDLTLKNSENRYPVNTIPQPAQALNIIYVKEEERICTKWQQKIRGTIYITISNKVIIQYDDDVNPVNYDSWNGQCIKTS